MEVWRWLLDVRDRSVIEDIDTHGDHGAVEHRVGLRGIVARDVDEARAAVDRFDGLVRIGIDEISYERGHRYLKLVADHDSGQPGVVA